MTRTVVVHGATFELLVEQKSKAVWRASGTYGGKLLQREGKRPNVAAARWREHAREIMPTPIASESTLMSIRP